MFLTLYHSTIYTNLSVLFFLVRDDIFELFRQSNNDKCISIILLNDLNYMLCHFVLGIQFQIQRMEANDSSDTSVASNPYRDNNIGVEKLLELNSEENHDDVCLSYIFTYRDFADGVLGLAWVGEKGNKKISV